MSCSSLCIRECVDAEFRSVLGALDNVSSIWPSVGHCELVHDSMASVDVEFDGLGAMVRLFPLVGGAAEPVTELLLIVSAGQANQQATARRFLEDLVRLVEKELHATPAAPAYSLLIS